MQRLCVLIAALSLAPLADLRAEEPAQKYDCDSYLSNLGGTTGPWDSVRNRRLIEVVLRGGIAFQSGDKVAIRAERYQTPFIDALVRELRAREAADVIVLYAPTNAEIAAAIDAGESPEAFGERLLPAATMQKLATERYSSVRIMGSNELGTPEQYDLNRWSQYLTALRTALKPYSAVYISHLPWTLIELPTPTQALLAFPEFEPNQALEAYREMVAEALYLNEPDPVTRWRESSIRLEARAQTLSELKLKKLHYTAAGTDFTIELHERARWRGGRRSGSGRKAQANFPHFENFVTPKRLTTEGRVQVKRPVEVMGQLVHDAWFEFKAGRVENFGASKGVEYLDLFFKQDPRNRYLGEIALVDFDSPVAAQPRIFYSIVFDENALSHIALGAGYAHTFTEPHPQSAEEEAALEMNSQAVKGHIDFMIGAPDMKITAETYDGRTITLVNQGKIVLTPQEIP